MSMHRASLWALVAVLAAPGACDCGGEETETQDASHPSADGGQTDGAAVDRVGEDSSGGGSPVVSAGGDVALLPGESAVLTGTFTDPDLPADSHVVAWSAVGGALPAGVSISPVDSLAATLSVDRALYEGGPAELALALQLTVTDAAGLTGSDQVEVTVLDERGGRVANTSSHQGTGYGEAGARHGFCGAVGHPCRDIADAMVNLRSRIAGGLADEPLIMVATTGEDYALNEEVLLDDDAAASGVVLSLECGFDPLTWAKPVGMWTRTPLRFRGALGVHITVDGVRVEGCDIQGVEPLALEGMRAAIFVEWATAEIHDNYLLGNGYEVLAVPEWTYGAWVVAQQDAPAFTISDNHLEGGRATRHATGLAVQGGVPQITGNDVVGGVAEDFATGVVVNVDEVAAPRQPPAVTDNPSIVGSVGPGVSRVSGLSVASGNVYIADNPRVVGCLADADECLGLELSGAGAQMPLVLERTSALGMEGEHEVARAEGARIWRPVLSSGCHLEGGTAAIANGVFVVSEWESEGGDVIVAGQGVDRDPADPEDGVAHGVHLGGAYTATLTGAEIRGTATSASEPSSRAAGMWMADGSTVELSGCTVQGGAAANESQGIRAEGCDILDVHSGTTVSGGAAQLGSAGIEQRCNQLVVRDSTVASDAAESSIAVVDAYDAGSASGAQLVYIQDSVLQSASATQASYGLMHESGTLELLGSQVVVAPSVFGCAVNARCAEATCEAGPLHISGSQLTAEAGVAASGLEVSDAQSLVVEDSEVASVGFAIDSALGIRLLRSIATMRAVSATSAHAAGSSQGLAVYGGELQAREMTIRAGDAPVTGGLMVTAQPTVVVTDSDLAGGDCPPGALAGNSAGVRVFDGGVLQLGRSSARGGASCVESYGVKVDSALRYSALVNSTLTAGPAAALSVGMWWNGACERCLIDSNVIQGGDTTGEPSATTRSIGLRVSMPAPVPAVETELAVANNRILGGSSERAIGVEVGGTPGGDLRLLHNNISAQGSAGEAGSRSYGVYLGADIPSDETTSMGYVVGNIIDAGVAESSWGIYERCSFLLDGTYTRGVPNGAWNNDYFPAIDGVGAEPTAYVGTLSGGLTCPRNNIINIDALNQLSGYGSGLANRASLDVDPLFEADGYHLQPISPLLNKAATSTGLWPPTGYTFHDIDGEERLNPAVSDIGCDEIR